MCGHIQRKRERERGREREREIYIYICMLAPPQDPLLLCFEASVAKLSEFQENPEIWKFGNLEPWGWKSGNLEIKGLEIWKLGNLESWGWKYEISEGVYQTLIKHFI